MTSGVSGCPSRWAFQQVVARPTMQGTRSITPSMTRRSVEPFRSISMNRSPSFAFMTVGSKPSSSSLIREKAEDGGYKLQPILVEVESFGCDSTEPIKLPYPHERSTDGKAQDEATGVLRSEHFLAYVPRSIHAWAAWSTDGLLFNSPSTRICDQWHRESFPALGSSTKPTSSLRSAVEPLIGLLGCASGLRRRDVGAELHSSPHVASFSFKSANQRKTSS